MHQINLARSAEAARSKEHSLTFRQAVLIARFDAVAYLEADLDAVVREACRVAAEGVGAKIAGVLQYRADEDAFVLLAGIG